MTKTFTHDEIRAMLTQIPHKLYWNAEKCFCENEDECIDDHCGRYKSHVTNGASDWQDESNVIPYEKRVWTVSPEEECTGWTTDSGCGGYGLPKHIAYFLALSPQIIRQLLEELDAKSR